jgi:hypothetical protein
MWILLVVVSQSWHRLLLDPTGCIAYCTSSTLLIFSWKEKGMLSPENSQPSPRNAIGSLYTKILLFNKVQLCAHLQCSGRP